MAGDYTQDEIAAVRIMIPDAEAVYGPASNEYLFTDDEIKLFLTVGQGNAMWAAGLAMIAVGNSEAMVGKVIRNYETETDASKLQREWRMAGDALVKAGREEVARGEVGIFEIVHPEWEVGRHPEGATHFPVRGFMPGGYQW